MQVLIPEQVNVLDEVATGIFESEHRMDAKKYPHFVLSIYFPHIDFMYYAFLFFFRIDGFQEECAKTNHLNMNID